MVTKSVIHYHMMKLSLKKKVNLEVLLNTLDDSDNRFFLEVDLIYLDEIQEKTKSFPFVPQIKNINPVNFTSYM